jgi:hypothetical protein
VDRGIGRDARSNRFLPGNRFGRGNPLAGHAAKIRAELLKAMKPADVREIIRKLILMAKTGDLAAIKELFDRTIGKAQPAEPHDDGRPTKQIRVRVVPGVTPPPARPEPDTISAASAVTEIG